MQNEWQDDKQKYLLHTYVKRCILEMLCSPSYLADINQYILPITWNIIKGAFNFIKDS